MPLYRGSRIKLKEARDTPLKIPKRPGLPDEIMKTLNPPHTDTAIDIGAYVGTWSKELAKYFRTVYAIEPNPRAFNKLKNDAPPQVKALHAACHERPMLFRLANPKGRGTQTSMMVEPDASGDVAGITIDGLCLRKVGLIKIDTEGCELSVLHGGVETIQRDHPILVVELDAERFGKKHVQSVRNLLKEWGYSVCLKSRVDHVFQ